MGKVTRRRWLQSVLLPAALAALPKRFAQSEEPGAGTNAPPDIIDTNVHLFDWPFRKLKYAGAKALVAKLRQHRITQAWAGSYEGLLHENLDGVNARLAEECRANGAGMLVPFGTINPALPDWEEDVRRCQEYRMPGFRLYPSYHNYTLQALEVARLLKLAEQRGLIVQIAVRMEDPRVHLPVTRTPPVDISGLPELLATLPKLRLQLLNAFNGTDPLRGAVGRRLIEETRVTIDCSHVEGQGGLAKLIAGDRDSGRPPLPVERLVFGSHAPYFPCESAVFKLFESALSRAEQEQVMRGNAEQFFHGGNVATNPAGVSKIVLNPANYGLPTRSELSQLRIWDMHYHGLWQGDFRKHEETLVYVERMGIERVLSLDIAGTPTDPLGKQLSAEKKQEFRQFLETNSAKVCGLIPIDPSDPLGSLQKIDEWIANGPCVGIKYYGGNPGGIRCSHENNDVIIRQAAKLNALIYIHAWYHMGGEPRRPGGANLAGESTPEDVAQLAARFPDVPLICGHSGGDWELGVRAVRPFPNVYLEFSGSDPHSGQVDFTVTQVGADRLVWGGHGPSRSYSTELAKVFDADLTQAQREKIFGGNLRRLAEPIFRKKGYKL
jgi:predicted TIM-barrel fold metal-dependent hydrolase